MKTCLNGALVNGPNKLVSNPVGGQLIMLGDTLTLLHGVTAALHHQHFLPGAMTPLPYVPRLTKSK